MPDVAGMPEELPIPGGRLFQARERTIFRTTRILAGLSFVLALPLAGAFRRADTSLLWPLLVAAAVPCLVYTALTRQLRRRRSILAKPFPREWELVLEQDVVFYRVLSSAGKERFRQQIQVFIGEKRITGIQCDLDTTTLVLTAASAIIPIFGFPDWEWHQINEVLVYPDRFEEGFSFGRSRDHTTLGMVGAGNLNGLMILSKPDLIEGFRNAGDKRNVGLHEFAHLLDKSDGVIDGVPSASLGRKNIGPWVDLMHRKMREIEAGKSDINPYALTNDAEFFAVVTEYFFERPGVMQEKHPDLYAALERVFNQKLSTSISAIREEIRRGRPVIGRNSLCPCGSGRKFKKCCLRGGAAEQRGQSVPPVPL